MPTFPPDIMTVSSKNTPGSSDKTSSVRLKPLIASLAKNAAAENRAQHKTDIFLYRTSKKVLNPRFPKVSPNSIPSIMILRILSRDQFPRICFWGRPLQFF